MEEKNRESMEGQAQEAPEAGYSKETAQTEDAQAEGEKQRETEDAGAQDTYIYIGPTVYGLIENTIIRGTRKDAEEYLKEVIDQAPQVRYLIVPTEKLAEKRAKARQGGTLLHKYYNDVLDLRKRKPGTGKEG